MRHTRVSNGANSSSTLLGLAPGGVCHASFVAKAAVRSYRTVSPLPDPSCEGHRRSVFCGTFPVLADGGRYPPPCSVEPGLSSPAVRAAAKAATRPPQRTLGPLRPNPDCTARAPQCLTETTTETQRKREEGDRCVSLIAATTPCSCFPPCVAANSVPPWSMSPSRHVSSK
jgi:hypothetical protein